MTTNEVKRIKNEWVAMLEKILTENNFNIINKGTKITFSDENGNVFNVGVTIPKGMRTAGGFVEYDGYMAAADYEIEKGKERSETRLNVLKTLCNAIASEPYMYTDILYVGNGEASFPVLDIDRNEIFVNVNLSVKSK